jgi:hypothetical protein
VNGEAKDTTHAPGVPFLNASVLVFFVSALGPRLDPVGRRGKGAAPKPRTRPRLEDRHGTVQNTNAASERSL